MKKLLLSILALPLLVSGATLHLAGDSTICAYSAKRAPLTGWGMKLPDKCADGVKINNRGASGSSSKSFRTPKDNSPKRQFWNILMKRVRKGDFVVIQFGINDAAKGERNAFRHAAADGEFQTNLKGFIEEVRAKGATPVLCTQIVFCRANKKGVIQNGKTHAGYVAAVKKVAAETGCDIIDLNGAALKKLNKMGIAEAEKLYMMGAAGRKNKKGDIVLDRVHLNADGAEFYASLFVELAKAQKLPIAKLFK